MIERKILIGKILTYILGVFIASSVLSTVMLSIASGGDFVGCVASTETAYRPTVLEGAMGVINVLLALLFGSIRVKVSDLEKDLKAVVTEKSCDLKRVAYNDRVTALVASSERQGQHVEQIYEKINNINVNIAILTENNR